VDKRNQINGLMLLKNLHGESVRDLRFRHRITPLGESDRHVSGDCHALVEYPHPVVVASQFHIVGADIGLTGLERFALPLRQQPLVQLLLGVNKCELALVELRRGPGRVGRQGKGAKAL
jgi:hypothetical protein